MIKIQVLGTGCPKCDMLMELTKQAVSELMIDCTVEKVNDIQEIIKYGVAITPALVVDGKVRTAGKVPSVDEIKKWIES